MRLEVRSASNRTAFSTCLGHNFVLRDPLPPHMSPAPTSKPLIEVFCAYAKSDERTWARLERRLKALARRDLVLRWRARKVRPGDMSTNDVSPHLDRARIVLFLISPDFIASAYCYGNEVTRALERQ